MKAIQLLQTGKPLVAREVPTPVPGPDEVLIQIHAAGICHSDVHYRNGRSSTGPLPLTLGHEVAGVIAASEAPGWEAGDRVCLHYLTYCGSCEACASGNEQFCPEVEMIGKDRDGGFAEYICMPVRSVLPLPDSIDFTEGAIMMCSTATAFHALNKARFRRGESIAIFGCGGLGFSALQLAKTMGASRIFAVDIDPKKLAQAEEQGAEPVDASIEDAADLIRSLTDGRGVDVAVELAGAVQTIEQAVRALAFHGRAALAGITHKPVSIDTYRDLVGREGEIIGVSDHLRSELEELLAWRSDVRIHPGQGICASVPLEAGPINGVLSRLKRFSAGTRTVIEIEEPQGLLPGV